MTGIAQRDKVREIVRLYVAFDSVRLEFDDVMDVQRSTDRLLGFPAAGAGSVPLANSAPGRPPRRAVVRFVPASPRRTILAAHEFGPPCSCTDSRTESASAQVANLGRECLTATLAVFHGGRREGIRSAERLTRSRIRFAAAVNTQPFSPTTTRAKPTTSYAGGRIETDAALFTGCRISSYGGAPGVFDINLPGACVGAILTRPTGVIGERLSARRAVRIDPLRHYKLKHRRLRELAAEGTD